jgi:hypothetical protein
MTDPVSPTPAPELKGCFTVILASVEVLSFLATIPLMGIAYILKPGPYETLGSPLSVSRAYDFYSALFYSIIALAVGVGSHVLRKRLSGR